MKKPLFIQVNEYEEIKELVQVLRKKYQDAKSLLAEIEKVHEEEEKELQTWNNTLQELDEKLGIVQKILE
ncbi:MAG: hypothetical protein QXR30_02005 [Candidatus Woesearchaeota archaeon]